MGWNLTLFAFACWLTSVLLSAIFYAFRWQQLEKLMDDYLIPTALLSVLGTIIYNLFRMALT